MRVILKCIGRFWKKSVGTFLIFSLQVKDKFRITSRRLDTNVDLKGRLDFALKLGRCSNILRNRKRQSHSKPFNLAVTVILLSARNNSNELQSIWGRRSLRQLKATWSQRENNAGARVMATTRAVCSGRRAAPCRAVHRMTQARKVAAQRSAAAVYCNCDRDPRKSTVNRQFRVSAGMRFGWHWRAVCNRVHHGMSFYYGL